MSRENGTNGENFFEIIHSQTDLIIYANIFAEMGYDDSLDHLLDMGPRPTELLKLERFVNMKQAHFVRF